MTLRGRRVTDVTSIRRTTCRPMVQRGSLAPLAAHVVRALVTLSPILSLKGVPCATLRRCQIQAASGGAAQYADWREQRRRRHSVVGDRCRLLSGQLHSRGYGVGATQPSGGRPLRRLAGVQAGLLADGEIVHEHQKHDAIYRGLNHTHSPGGLRGAFGSVSNSHASSRGRTGSGAHGGSRAYGDSRASGRTESGGVLGQVPCNGASKFRPGRPFQGLPSE